MFYAFYCLDKAGAGEIRAQNRAAHVAYLKAQGDKLVTAGPLLGDDEAAMVGSLIVLDLADRAAAESFAAGDPYAHAGLFRSVEIRPWKKVL
jgi:hypothetical protein